MLPNAGLYQDKSTQELSEVILDAINAKVADHWNKVATNQMKYTIEETVARMYIPEEFKNRYLSIKTLSHNLPRNFTLSAKD